MKLICNIKNNGECAIFWVYIQTIYKVTFMWWTKFYNKIYVYWKDT